MWRLYHRLPMPQKFPIRLSPFYYSGDFPFIKRVYRIKFFIAIWYFVLHVFHHQLKATRFLYIVDRLPVLVICFYSQFIRLWWSFFLCHIICLIFQDYQFVHLALLLLQVILLRHLLAVQVIDLVRPVYLVECDHLGLHLQILWWYFYIVSLY